MTCIVGKTAWIFAKTLLGILCHKLSTIMLIRRSAGCFKGHFQIFGILGNYFIMARAPLWHVWWGLSNRFLCYQLECYQILLTGERSYQGLKDATSFGLISDKSAEKSGGKFEYLPILHTGYMDDTELCVHMQISWVMSLPPHLHTKTPCGRRLRKHGELKKFEYFDPNIWAFLSDNKPNKMASCRYW